MTAQQKVDLLLSFAKIMARESELNDLLNTMADYAKDLLDANRCSIFLYDSKEDELWTTVAHDTEGEIRIPADSGVAGYSALSKEIQIVVDAYNDFRFNPEVDQTTGYTTKSILTVPLLNHNDEVLGVFQALNKETGLFTVDDAEMLLLISNYASKSIENAMLYSQLTRTQTQIITKLSSAAEFKDADTSMHTRRVGYFAAIIAKGLGLAAKDVELIRLTAPMHDVGKIGIADAIIHKPGKLDVEEFDEMKKHAMIGFELLGDEDNNFLRTAAEISRDHHEKVDGTGYPQGLIGDEISLFGRITAIADVFDALTSKRPYKDAWSLPDAMKYLQDNRGTHFDTTLVDIFVSHESDVKEIYKKYQD
jgi:HD-GYP domain-containing protein (c-di-GMP phosphodiesterase class II)